MDSFDPIAAYQDPKPALVHAVQKLDIRPGDTLLVKLGDPAHGWVPSAEQERHVLELIEALTPEVRALVYNWSIEAATLRELGLPERQVALESIATLVRGTPMHALLVVLAEGQKPPPSAQTDALLGQAFSQGWVRAGGTTLTELGQSVVDVLGYQVTR